MMNVDELKSTILEGIMKLNLDKNFLENPAFKSVILKINSNLDAILSGISKYEKIPVTFKDNKIKFSYSPIDYSGKNTATYAFEIYSNNSKELVCKKNERISPSFIDNKGNYIIEKYVDEIDAIMNEDMINLTTNHVEADNMNCSSDKCCQITHATKMQYNKYGIMVSKDDKIFDRCTLNTNIEAASDDMLLYIAKNCFGDEKFSNYYYSRVNFNRKTLDTADYTVYDENRNVAYSGVTQLDLDDLKELNYNGGSIYQQYIYIPKLSSDEIFSMINNENDFKVQEGLKLYANGRENFYYDSSEDDNFIFEGQTLNEKSKKNL